MTEQFTFGGEIIWRPTSDHIEQANLTAFMRLHGIRDFDELMQKSTSDVAWFTDAVLKFLDMAADETGATGNEDVAFHVVVGSPRRHGGHRGVYRRWRFLVQCTEYRV